VREEKGKARCLDHAAINAGSFDELADCCHMTRISGGSVAAIFPG
jgi:hypothetical protein